MNHLDPYGYMIPEIFNDGEVIPPPVIRDGSTVAWFLSDEPTTLTLDGANRVSRWNDYLGSGHDLIQGVGADQPLWSANGVLFDGATEYMKCGVFAYVQPEMIYMVVKQVTWTDGDYIFDGNVTNNGMLRQETLTPNLTVYSGAFLANADLAVDTWGIVRVLFNGALSEFIINDLIPTTGNTGAVDMGGFTLSAQATGNIQANIEVKEIILRNVADTAPNEAAIYAYLAAKYGI